VALGARHLRWQFVAAAVTELLVLAASTAAAS
jgi:hypothetical protein